MESFEERVLGESPDVIQVSTSEENRAAAVALVRQAKRSVDIFSRHLDPAIYDRMELIEAMKQLVLDHRRARIRIVLSDPQPIVRDGHRLAALALRLSSFMQIRVPGPPHKGFNQALLIVDGTGYVHRELADRYEGTTCFADRGQAGELTRLFNQIWDLAVPDPNLRQMRL
jgi:hypothetical protein